MKVKFTRNSAYKNKRVKAGDTVDMDERDLPLYQKAVEVVTSKKKATKKASNKMVKNTKNK